jgi:hypothetical protein
MKEWRIEGRNIGLLPYKARRSAEEIRNIQGGEICRSSCVCTTRSKTKAFFEVEGGKSSYIGPTE